MGVDRSALMDILEGIGQRLKHSATLCLIGSGPGIVSGQPERQTADIDVWGPASDFDLGDLRAACEACEVLFDPKGEIPPEAVYLQIVEPGVVRLPRAFDTDRVGRFGNLTLVMPTPALLAAAKLVRNEPRDMDDVVWWQKERAVTLDQIRDAIGTLPNEADRDAAEGNVVLVELVGSAPRRG